MVPPPGRYLFQKRGRVQRILGFMRRFRLQLEKKHTSAASSSRSQSDMVPPRFNQSWKAIA